jgi:hypothetical protein
MESSGSQYSDKSIESIELFDVGKVANSYIEKAPFTLKVCVVDGWGTYSSMAINSWNELNTNHSSYGSTPLLIDYTTLDKENITYTDLVNSEADVLIISDNLGTVSTQDYYLTETECQAIVQYVEEGHGLYMSAGT